MNNQAQQVYMRTQVNTATPGELTLMLYNGCLRFLKQAQQAIEVGDFVGKNENIKRAQDILDEFLITLNPQYEISSSLKELYQYIKQQMLEANLYMKLESLTIAIDLVTELRNTWVEAIKITKKERAQVQ